MSKKIVVQIELSTRDIQSVIKLAQELGLSKEPRDEETFALLEKVAAAFEKAAGKRL